MTPRKASRRRTSAPKTSLACRGKTASGKPCRAHAGRFGYCFAHDPSLAAKRDQAKRNGGRRRAYGNGSSPSIRSIEDVRQGLCGVVGRLEVQDNTVSVARALTGAYSVILSTLEKGDLERRLEALEEMMAEKRPEAFHASDPA